ncbi:MAG: hypothetical protein K2X47_06740, partial [Bdellovibrionales bacterium]|nr:hypothetical protein [Bdellovibrionales bacterium]
VSGGYDYQDGDGYNMQFTSGNTVTTLSMGADGSSSASISNYNNLGQISNSTFYNSLGAVTSGENYVAGGSYVEVYTADGQQNYAVGADGSRTLCYDSSNTEEYGGCN